MTKLNCIAKLNWVTKACAVFLLWAATALALPAQTFTSLLSFGGANGSNPFAGLAQGTDGNFYGPTYRGGVNGEGEVFSVTPGGALTTLHSFGGTDGAYPYGGLVQATDGNFYGTTAFGGANDSCGYGSCGTVFKITQGGTLTTLYTFYCPNEHCPNGTDPLSGLVEGMGGNLYGTTSGGGGNGDGYGTVFSITEGGTLTTLYQFTGGADGALPTALILGTDGNFYGTTADGGTKTANCNLGQENGCGTIFKVTPRGRHTTLYSFCSQGSGCPGGAAPFGLTQGTDGNFYGIATTGGTSGCYGGGCGTVFRITAGGTFATLYQFTGGADGALPTALILGTDGNFYGGTTSGGPYDNCNTNGPPPGCGTLFQITPRRALTTLHNFAGTDGSEPTEMLQDTDGSFYGMTFSGGDSSNCGNYGCGTVFSLSMGLGPFVKTNPAAGKVGATVGILGTNLTGATGVKFNGTATAFRVVSSTFIEAKVPSGATTGKVTVQLPCGTLSSNVPFIVLR